MQFRVHYDDEMTTSQRTAVAWAATGLLAAGYLVLLLSNTCYFAAGPDTSGYLSEARMLSSGRVSLPIQPLIDAGLQPSLGHLFTPYGFAPGQQPATMVPTYPVGAPLHQAVAAIVGGWRRGPFVVAPLAAVGCLFLFFLVAGHFELPASWRVAGAVLLAAMPLFIANALMAASDVLATFWGLLTMLAALKASADRRWCIATGVAFAIGVAVRPTNILFALPIVFAMGARLSRLVIAALAALPFAAALMTYHHVLYGSAFVTGYGHAGSIVSLGAAPPCLSPHSTWLASILTPAVFPGGLLVAFLAKISRWKRALLVSWFGVFFLFYAYYGFCPDTAAIRFLLPALPPLLIGFLLVVRALTETAMLRGMRGRAFATLLILAVLTREVTLIGRMHVLHANEWEAIFPQTVAWVEEHVPPGGIVLSSIVSGALHYEGRRPTLRWDQLDPNTSALLSANPHFQGPWYAIVSDVEGGVDHLRSRVPGRWEAAGRLRDVTFWRRVE